MGNQSPNITMTNQDHAISKAIGEVFPDSCHKLCFWHISRNAHSHLGNLNENVDFHALFHKCFEKEFRDGVPLIWREIAQNGTSYTFEVMMDENSSRVRTVHFNTTTMEIRCTCKMFNFCGYLCSHAIRILSI
ncbi:hypothetical protein E1A91_D11G202600v1 [Gossypium mustelinum]|uniref:Protein FAR1-RELATED SEQUENCE n=1 Tax=Gossypium mustelinum TaxID=34275 RepID=A0A5D2STX5_GOSMU|nr:hypothetical protein E1A91_D11G202600v1 [Gossypium mustelinum]